MENYFGAYGFYKQEFNKRNYNEVSMVDTLKKVADYLLNKGYENAFLGNERFRFDGLSNEDMNSVREIVESNSNSRKYISKYSRKYMRFKGITLSNGDCIGELTRPYVYISI